MEKTQTENRGWAAVAYLIFFLPLLVDKVRDDSFVRFHIRQGLGLLVASIVLKFATMIILMPLFVLMGFLSLIVPPLLNIFILVLLIVGILNAAKGEKKPLPVIGEWANKYLKI